MADPRSGASNPNSNSPPPTTEGPAQQDATGDRVSEKRPAEAVEKVMRETLEGSGGLAAIQPQELAALRTIAARHGNVPLTLDPVATDLVESLLVARLGPAFTTPDLARHVAHQVATTLMDDEEAQQRLSRLWSQLHSGGNP